MTSTYELKHIEQKLAEDGDIAELGIHLTQHGDQVFVRGQVASSHNGDRVLEVVRRELPGREVVDELTCVESDLSTTPSSSEEIR